MGKKRMRNKEMQIYAKFAILIAHSSPKMVCYFLNKFVILLYILVFV